MSRPAREPTAWLESIELENVRCFHARQTVPFTTRDGNKAQWTLLLGENGTGKSTLLQVCAMLMPRRWELDDDLGKYVVRSHAYDDQAGTWLRLPRVDKFGALQANFAISMNIHNHLVSWRWQQRPVAGALAMGPESPFPSFDVIPRIPACLAYAPYRSPWAFVPDDTSAEKLRGLFIGFTQLRNPVSWYKERTYAAINPNSSELSRKNANRILSRIKKTLIALLPDVEDLQIRTDQEGRGPNQLLAKTPYGWARVDALGLGYQSVLSLAVDIASRLIEHYPDSPNPLIEPAVILIDEVDLHLHPKWQRTLQEELSRQFPKAQFIATAHSPLVVQSSPDANILLLKREKDYVVVDRAPEVIKTWRVDQILTSDLFGIPTARPPNLDRLIQERDLILGKDELSKRDEKRLEELHDEIDTIPGGESRWEMKAAELIREAAQKIKSTGISNKKQPAPKARQRAPKKKGTGGSAFTNQRFRQQC